LKKQNARRPNGRGAAEIGKQHFPNHRLACEKKKRAEKESGRKDEDSQDGFICVSVALWLIP